MMRLLSAVRDEREEVFVTSDLNSSASDFFSFGFKVTVDVQIPDLPADFPSEYTLIVKH